jgi:hypothetical protein
LLIGRTARLVSILVSVDGETGFATGGLCGVGV